MAPGPEDYWNVSIENKPNSLLFGFEDSLECSVPHATYYFLCALLPLADLATSAASDLAFSFSLLSLLSRSLHSKRSLARSRSRLLHSVKQRLWNARDEAVRIRRKVYRKGAAAAA